MSLEGDLTKSIGAIEKAIAAQESPRVRAATLGFGGIAAAIGVIREFCRSWPKIRPLLVKIADFLGRQGQEASERSLRLVIRFLDAVAKVCPIVP